MVMVNSAASLTAKDMSSAQAWHGSRCPGRLRALPTITVIGLDIVAVRETVAKLDGPTGTGKCPAQGCPPFLRPTRLDTRKARQLAPWCQLVERPPLGPCADL